MSIIYNVTINSTEKENIFQVTWRNMETDGEYSFEQTAEITPEETQQWQQPKCQPAIGQKLFRFLDGDDHYFQDLLQKAHRRGESFHIHLRTNRETADWPFELLAHDNKFLLPHRLHLDRYVSDWGVEKDIPPKDRPLKLLFMACSALDVKPVLDYEREEEAIYQVTGNLTIDMEVEDSGSLEGLRSHLEREQYDVVHLSGHADIDEKGRPFFIMENKTGHQHNVFPDELWRDALIENPPRLLLLSGCRTGETPDNPDSTAAVSYSRQLVENYNVPAVIGWGRSVSDNEAIHAQKMLFHELCRGKSILDAVQRARYELLTDFRDSTYPAWPLLRLFSSGIPLNPIVQKGQRMKPKTRRMKHVFLENSRVKVLAEGFVGRRRQIQTGLRALEQDYYKVGIMILGAGGLGKSCLAGKICERFTDFTLIIVHGKLDADSLERALTDAFISSQDEKGREILSQETTMAKKLANLCATSFKEKNYLLLLDDFDQNLAGADKGSPGPLRREAGDLLKVLFRYLPFSGKMTQMIVTGRYDFSLLEQNQDMVKERLDKVWLTSFGELEQQKKVTELENIINCKDQLLESKLVSAGRGNPLLMEWLDEVVGEMAAKEESQLLAAVKNRQEEFIREHAIREVLQQGGEQLARFLGWFSIFRRPVLEEGAAGTAEKAGLEKWNQLLHQGMALSLVEFDQAHRSYQVTPLLREELLNSMKELQASHEAAVEYYRKIYANQRDQALAEELTFHSSGCG
ncbi:MAG: CHAT domain-containing protein [bacterium]|nr:CHAT domain-containing protein [bacterium]